MSHSSNILVFDHNQREREKSSSFLAKASADFKTALAGLKAEFASARTEPDPEKRRTAYGGLEKRLEALSKDSDVIVNAHKRLRSQQREEMALQWNRIEGLLSYGVAVGMCSSADKFICSVLADARKARTDAERESLWSEAELALPAAVEAAEAGYGVHIPDDANG